MSESISHVNKELSKYIERLEMPETLKKSMDYSLQAGGKRIRPLLIFATLAAFRKDIKIGLPVACAVEMIHTYSLIHDDLPSMDDDDLRRGKPTNHKVFGEAIAILAGDGLLTYSFQLLSELNELNISETQKLSIIYELAKAAGPEGMVGGQAADMEGENQTLTLTELEYIHTHKTGKLLTFCVKAGAILSGADTYTLERLETFANHIGLAFQIQDDILDIEGTSAKLGKTQSDNNHNKSTYPSLLTLAGAKKKLQEHIHLAKSILRKLPLETEQLEKITDLIGKRDH
ncbi:polyprenyl synthetase family protein [Caldibacillus lycopersici]|uniref:Farnesyl diphosphate synthase n=1 Tax=Perspicuibacillus lycopersici TaxID=1325689 RepID=A0AAE3LTD3_9BACI|nr:farnesyl diphosphate synthase [Perspicuibacillus lycopersici]MCU9613828.1 polyprenyl synthetase family protein [Perspicuibacillus lycopersici]